MIACGNSGIFQECLRKVRPESDICIISCLTNFLSSADGPVTVSQRVDPVFQDFRAQIIGACLDNPDRYYLVSPPMYRTSPTWYRDGLPEVLTLFSQSLIADRPANLHLLPSFPTPDYEQDGVHLTPYSGLEFVCHLFDASLELLSLLEATTDEVVVRSCETTRVLEDRVMVLEQDHRRLNRAFESKSAVDAEMSDFRTNERNEDSFVIFGLSKIPDEIVGKPWQDQAVRDVQAVLTILMGREFQIVFIKNSTSRATHPPPEITYTVKMSSVSDSSKIRKKFGSFFLGSQDRRPDALRHINIKNMQTPETKTRVSVLKLLAKRYRDSNPGSRVQVISYDPRPLIKITPAASASDRRIKVYNYVEAVQNLPCNFTNEEIIPIVRRLNPKLLGQVRSLFVVLSDDMFRQQLRKFERKKASGSANPISNPEAAQEPDGVAVASPPTAVAVVPGTSGTGTRSRSIKRGASVAIGPPSKSQK